ncbi:MAG: N-acetylmuramoyl-L-alanine amidase [Stenotrophobium sp.]
MRKFFFIVLLCLAPLADAAELHGLQLLDSPGNTRAVFDFQGAVTHRVFALSNPDRVVIDITPVDRSGLALVDRTAGKGYVKRLRSAERNDGTLRVVLDMAQPVDTKSLVSNTDNGGSYRLVLDLYGKPALKTAPASGSAQVSATAPAAPVMRLVEKPIVVAVDPGHGGDDPGARGPSGLLEKNVALSIARKLVVLIDEQPGMKAVLTRDGDYYVGLRQRIQIARKAQADLFVSVHCNALTRPNMRGTAVYVLSSRGVTNEHARWLANQENAADMVGGIDIQDKDHELAAVLVDLSQSATLEASFDVGNRILESMGEINALQKPRVQQAAFVVLKAPDIPSVLVETAFITNPHDERLLASDSYREKMADSILAGIQGYFKNYRPHQQVVENDPDQARPAPGPTRPGKAMEVSLERKLDEASGIAH